MAKLVTWKSKYCQTTVSVLLSRPILCYKNIELCIGNDCVFSEGGNVHCQYNLPFILIKIDIIPVEASVIEAIEVFIVAIVTAFGCFVTLC